MVGVVHRKERFRASQVVALARVPAQEFVQRLFAAVEAFPIMALIDRLFVPCSHN